MNMNVSDIDQIIEVRGKSKDAVIPLLQEIQNKYRYLPQEALNYICNQTEITPAEIIGIASFYSQFRFEPVGEHIIKVCTGTACHVKGSTLVHDAFKRELNINEGRITDDQGKYTVEKVSCLGCCTLAPVVQIDNVTYGHVKSGQIKNILEDFEKQKPSSGKKFRTAEEGEIQGEVRIGLGSCCMASGSDDICKAIEQSIDVNSLHVQIRHVGCVGMCHRVPLVEVVPKNKDSKLYAKVKAGDIDYLLSKHFKPAGFFQRLKHRLYQRVEAVQTDRNWDGLEKYSIDVREKNVSAFLENQIPIATELRGVLSPLDIEAYIEFGGFVGLKKAMNHSSKDIIHEIQESDIRGRGGAGFPTYLKWKLVASQKSDVRYLVCNGDEGDPGAFMDRMLLESYPFRIIEGILIAAFTIKANKGFFYIRAEYPLAVQRVQAALEIARRRGYLGEDILNSGFDFDIEVIEGAGAFVCGEETALMASIQGRRGFPSVRPPFPAEKGLWGKPTLVNNTETFAQIPYILSKGSSEFARIGSEHSHGTKVFALAGKIQRGGLIEVPLGITINEIVENIGGGIANNHEFKAVQIGGPSGGCIPARLGNTPVDFHSLNEIGAMMGSGGLVVLDNTDCMVDMARYFLSFTQNESCGKCTFCRVGTRRMLDILNRLTSGKGKKDDLSELEKLALWVKKGSLCGLGKTAPNPVLSTLRYFRDEYEAHISGSCPTGKCKELITYAVNDQCIGCTLCSQNCPVGAIPFAPHEKHEIDTEKCIKCDTCRQVCPEQAINVL
jgi:NADH:ubiquinone oxidoreductase subunit F (NADH-binding)/NADH:ubiquinone oxidoreductase subunit E